MKSDISSLELHHLVAELQALVGAKLNKVYELDTDKNDFLFLFHKTGPGRFFLRIKLPSAVYITESKQVFPENPPGFCVFLRKYLNNARILEVRQHGFERILEIVFDTKDGPRILICELFSKGNMILVDQELKVKGLLSSETWQSRTIRGGAIYEYPPAQPDVKSISEEDFKKTLLAAEKDSVVKALAVDFGFGGVYAEEICARAKVAKDEKIKEKDAHSIFKAVQEILLETISANKNSAGVFPFRLSTQKELVSEGFESFNKALDAVLTENILAGAAQKIGKEKSTKEDKIQKIITAQSERLILLEREIAENQKKGELIYEHYSELKELIENINIDRKKMGWDEVKEKYKDHVLIKSIDEKQGKIVLEL